MIKDLMVLVPLKKTLALYFARVSLYCSPRSLMYGVTTLAPSINFPGNGSGFLLGFALLKELCWVVVVLQDFVKVINFFCKECRCKTYLFNSVDEGVDNR